MGSGSKPGAVGKAEVFNGILNESKCYKKLAYRCNVAITKAYPQRAAATMRYTITCRSSFNAELERQALIAGLHAPNAAISPKYFYDAYGGKLFDRICDLPEYYLTQT